MSQSEKKRDITLEPPPALPVLKSVFDHAFVGYGAILALVATILAIPLSIVLWDHLPTEKITLAEFVVGVVVAVAVVVCLLGLSRSQREENLALRKFMDDERTRLLAANSARSRLVVARVVPVASTPYVKAHCLLLVEDCPAAAAALAIGQSVSVLLGTETHEIHLGAGQVRPRQTDGVWVITLDFVFPGADPEVKALLAANATDKIGRLRIGAVYDLQGLGAHVSNGSAGPPPEKGGA